MCTYQSILGAEKVIQSASWFQSDPFMDAGMGRGGQPGGSKGNSKAAVISREPQ